MSDKATYGIHSAESIGSAIRHFRLQAGLSQAELAERAGLNRTYVSTLEQGRENEQLRRILRILKQLDVSVALQKGRR